MDLGRGVTGEPDARRPGGPACRCGHDRIWHQHYRAGTDCAAPDCGCVRFRRCLSEPRLRDALGRLTRWLR